MNKKTRSPSPLDSPHFCLGKAPAIHDPRDLVFARYRTTPLPKLPSQFGHEGLVKSWGMLANDRVGDCYVAGSMHETMLLNAEGGKTVLFTDDCAIKDYSGITGYDGTPATDKGTQCRDGFKYRQQTGLIDAAGVRHKIGPFGTLPVGDINRLLEALYIFGTVGIGVQLPTSAMDQFNAGKPWSVVRGSSIEGGHYVPVVAKRDMIYIVTWERLVPVTNAFIAKYMDEGWFYQTEESLTNGKTLEGFDANALQEDSLALAA